MKAESLYPQITQIIAEEGFWMPHLGCALKSTGQTAQVELCEFVEGIAV